MSQVPTPIYEFDPDKPPRTSAIILVVCGLIAVGFILISMLGGGDDLYGTESGIYDDGPIQGRGNIMPNMWRGPGVEDETKALDRNKPRPAPKPAGPTTLPFMQSPIQSPFTPMTRPGNPLSP